MFKHHRTISGEVALSDRDYGELLFCDGDALLQVPPVERCTGMQIFILPLGKAKVTLISPDGSTVLDAGDGESASVKLTGQRIYGLFASDRWVVTGL